MIVTFTRKTEGNRRLILIFAGWGSDATLYEDIEMHGWDVAVVHSYSAGSDDLAFTAAYDTVYLYAWSLGVAAAEAVADPGSITAAFAVNGTGRPVGAEHGIPEEIYHGTHNSLDERNLRKFRRRMTADSAQFQRLLPMLPANPDIEQLKSDLRYIAALTPRYSIEWTRAYISNGDSIIPPDAQTRYWQTHPGQPPVISVAGAHYLPLSDIVSSTLADTRKIGNRFHGALKSYDTNASAQRTIAIHLSDLLGRLGLPVGLQTLEIGPGSGLFTHLYSENLQPSEADFVELYPLKPFGIAPREHYYVQDAEIFAAECDRHYDVILSTSVIQWFSDPATFFANTARMLRPGGVLACSTFLPGTLATLDAVRPSPMLYPSASQIEMWLKPHFSDIRLVSDEISIPFASPREALLHLKHTGAGGSFPSSVPLRQLLTILDKGDGTSALTYRPLYILAKL